MEVKDIIRKRREELGLTYEQLGDIVGVGKSTVRKWETGMIENMKRSNIAALARALDISPVLLIGIDEEERKYTETYELQEDEIILMNKYEKLNLIGKKEALKRVSELTEINKYVESNDKNYLMPIAAHDKDGDFSEEDIQHDLDIMKDDKFWD